MEKCLTCETYFGSISDNPRRIFRCWGIENMGDSIEEYESTTVLLILKFFRYLLKDNLFLVSYFFPLVSVSSDEDL